MDRRDFLKFVGMASSATILSSCGVEKSTEKLVSLTVPHQDPDYLPGEPLYRNTTCTECPAGCGVTAKLIEYNPIKLEGNEGHPLNEGALCLRGQASLMRLYHPERLKVPLLRRRTLKPEQISEGVFEAISWDEALKLITERMEKAAGEGRRNVYFSGMTSGSLSDLIDQFCQKTAVERLPEYEVFGHVNLREAYRLLFGRREIPNYAIENCDYLLTIGADIIETFVAPTYFATQIHQAKTNHQCKWVHAEPHASLTGFKAAQRIALQPRSEPYLLAYLLDFVIKNNLTKNRIPADVQRIFLDIDENAAAKKTGLSEEVLMQVLQDLIRAKNPLLIAGGVSTTHSKGLETAVLAGLFQWAMGMTDSLVDFTHAFEYQHLGSLLEVDKLSRRLENQEIGVIFVSKSDPLATLPASLQFAEKFEKAAFRVVLTDFENTETARNCDLLLPISTAFESWGDVRPRRGLTGIVKPVIEKLYDTRSEGEILLTLSEQAAGGGTAIPYQEWLQERWSGVIGAEKVEKAINDGYYRSAVPRVTLSLNDAELSAFLNNTKIETAAPEKVLFAVPSIRTFDGRSKVLPLSQEIPDPLTSVSYGNWISVSRKMAEELNLSEKTLVHKYRDEVRFEASGKAITLPAVVQAGLPDDVSTIHFDQLNTAMLAVDSRTGECLSEIKEVSFSKTATQKALAIMAGSLEQGHRNIVREEHPHEISWLKGDETLYPEVRYPEYRWAMSIDLESCIGCSACVAACYIENNIPSVGKEEHLKGREMSWIRVQPYYFEDGTMDSLIMLCQQCGAAPCENVCPVYATYHNDEGLNVMVYNRCVGTRYCHNNCPYKVRRFNWFDWTDRGAWQEPMTRMLNPDVWVRPKGVMEKCTFCIQRIRRAKDKAKDENRKVGDGEVIPACAQTCPTNAITFGNILDEESEIYKKSQSNRKFHVLDDLGTNSAVHYLRKEETA